jgi:hypothetical protein
MIRTVMTYMTMFSFGVFFMTAPTTLKIATVDHTLGNRNLKTFQACRAGPVWLVVDPFRLLQQTRQPRHT